MKGLHHASATSNDKTTSKKSTKQNSKSSKSINRHVDAATLEKNTKVDAELLSDFYRLVDASGGAIQRARGARYRLSHPLGSNDVPTNTISKSENQNSLKIKSIWTTPYQNR